MNKFHWGKVLDRQTVSNGDHGKPGAPMPRIYEFVTYHPYKSNSKQVDDSLIYYHIYVNDVDTNHSARTLEEALLLAVAYAQFGKVPSGMDFIYRALKVSE